jgi:hypothetical protein
MKPRVLLPAAVAVAAVALGLLLGLVPAGKAGLIGPLRTFALAAALTVVLTHLLPEALEELGASAVLLVAAAAALPAWWRLLTGVGTHTHSGGHAGLIAGYLGLLVHHVGDGIGLGAYATLPGGARAHVDVLLALAVHTVPLVAVVTFAFRAVSGTRAALLRAGGLALASVSGVVLSAFVADGEAHRFSAWIAAGVAGLLLHVVTHDLGRDLPATSAGRGIDFVAAVAGVAVSLLGGGEHGVHGHVHLDVLGKAAVEGVPALVLAYALVALLLRLTEGRALRLIARFSGPALAIDGVFLALSLAGFRFALFVLASALVIAWVSKPQPGNAATAAVVHAHAHAHSHAHVAGVASHASSPKWQPIDAMLREALPWAVAGLLVAAVVRASLEANALSALHVGWALPLAVLVGLPLRLPPAAAVFIAVALWERGLAPEAVVAFVCVSIAPGAEDLERLALTAQPLALPKYLAKVAVAGLAFGLLGRFALFTPLGAATPFAFPAIVVFVAALAFVTWRSGVRGLLAHLFASHDSAPHVPATERGVSGP